MSSSLPTFSGSQVLGVCLSAVAAGMELSGSPTRHSVSRFSIPICRAERDVAQDPARGVAISAQP